MTMQGLAAVVAWVAVVMLCARWFGRYESDDATRNTRQGGGFGDKGGR